MIGLILGLCGPNTHPKKVSVAVVEQPVMDHHVPGAVIVGERRGVPPVLGNRDEEETAQNSSQMSQR